MANGYPVPVAARFHSYQLDLPEPAAACAATVYRWPAFQRWYRAALQETETL